MRGYLQLLQSSNESYARLAGYDVEFIPLKKEEAAWDHADYCYECNFKFGVTGRHHCRYATLLSTYLLLTFFLETVATRTAITAAQW